MDKHLMANETLIVEINYLVHMGVVYPGAPMNN